MKFVNPSVEILSPADYTWESLLKHGERCGRICYKSENLITDDSASKFIKNIIATKHYGVLEHIPVYMCTMYSSPAIDIDYIDKFEFEQRYKNNPYSKVKVITKKFYEHYVYVTTNYRVLVENGWIGDLKDFGCEPTGYHEKRITAHFVCSIGTSREFNRHRANSICEESTRYCNYAKDKFGNELTFIKPNWFDTNNEFPSMSDHLEHQLLLIEEFYMNMINNGFKAQDARCILPLCTKTEIVHTAFQSDWEHFIDLRALDKTGKAHPDAKYLAIELQKLINNL